MLVTPWVTESAAIANAADIDRTWLARFPLSTRGRHIVDQQGRRFKLAGVNWYGASDAFHVVGGLDVQSLRVICATVRQLGFTVVRLPFSSEMLRAREPAPGFIDYGLNPQLRGKSPLEIMDEVVRELGRNCVAVILNNHTTIGAWSGGVESNGLWFLPLGQDAPWGPHTEAQWIEDWRMLALRYGACPQVMGYDLRNEVRLAASQCLGGFLPWFRWPKWRRDVAVGDHREDAALRAGRCCCGPVTACWASAALACSQRLQEVNGDALIIVERICWPQESLDEYLASPGPLLPHLSGKLVLAVHSYSWSGPGRFIVRWGAPTILHPFLRCLSKTGLVNWTNHGDMAQGDRHGLKALMRKEWGFALEQDIVPVWVSEFGAAQDRPEEMHWLAVFVDILREFDVDWAYWPLNVGDKPGTDNEDESYGMLTKRWEAPPSGSDPRLNLLETIMQPCELAARP